MSFTALWQVNSYLKICRGCRRTQRFEAHIWESKKQIYLGGFDSEVLAAKSHGEVGSRGAGALRTRLGRFGHRAVLGGHVLATECMNHGMAGLPPAVQNGTAASSQ